MKNTLSQIVQDVIDASTDQDRIMPSWVANGAFQVMDADNVSPVRVKIAALQTLKQIASQLLRGRFQPQNDADAQQHVLWPNLQDRYPVAHSKDDEPSYVKLEHLSEMDVDWNINRLRAAAGTKLKHANALEQWKVEYLYRMQQSA